MKRWLCLAFVFLLLLSGCGKEEERAQESPEAPARVTQPPSDPTEYRSIEINNENWRDYFELCEIPLYAANSFEEVDELRQNYCLVLKDDYAWLMRPDGDWSVRFEVSFTVDTEILDYDAETRSFLHTSDHRYASEAVKTAVFDCNALGKEAVGMSYGDYVSVHSAAWQNAFFTGIAQYSYDVWSGFYIDLDQVQILSASGKLELRK